MFENVNVLNVIKINIYFMIIFRKYWMRTKKGKVFWIVKDLGFLMKEIIIMRKVGRGSTRAGHQHQITNIWGGLFS